VDGAEAVAAGTCDGVKRAARRKLQHELGLADSCLPTASQLQYVTRLLYSAPCPPPSEPGWGESEVDYILLARLAIRGEDIVANEDEVRAVRFVTQDELQGMLADPALSWSPWFRIIADKFLGQWWESLDTLLLQDQGGGGGGGLLDRRKIHKVI
jgi:isopentenyl-diphosphate delta-isomerase